MDALTTPRGLRPSNPIPIEQRDAVDIPTTAALLGVSRRTIYELISDGRLRAVKLRSRTLIPRTERMRLLADPADKNNNNHRRSADRTKTRTS